MRAEARAVGQGHNPHTGGCTASRPQIIVHVQGNIVQQAFMPDTFVALAASLVMYIGFVIYGVVLLRPRHAQPGDMTLGDPKPVMGSAGNMKETRI